MMDYTKQISQLKREICDLKDLVNKLTVKCSQPPQIPLLPLKVKNDGVDITPVNFNVIDFIGELQAASYGTTVKVFSDFANGGNSVISVAGKTGIVTLVKGDVGLGNVDNTTDSLKPISIATQTALDLKQNILYSGVNIKTINGQNVLGSGDIVIAGGGGSGEVNTASNVGTGEGLFKQKTGVNLELKSLLAGSGIIVTNNANDLTIATTITQYTDGLAQAAVVIDGIADSDTTHAPSRNAVFDALATKQPLDADLTAIAALTGTSGFLKTNGAGTWTVDTNTYLTGNQSITLSGEASGSGTTGISVTLSNSAVIGKVLTGFTSTTGTILSTDSILQAIQKLDGNLASATAGGVSSVTGTLNRITSTGGSTPTIDISSAYVGQTSITTLGTVTTGTYQATPIVDAYIANSSNWNTAYTNRITSLTTTGNSGVSTLALNVLNIPNYTLAGLGGQPQLSGTGFVKISGTTISYDNSTYLTGNQSISLTGEATGSGTTSLSVTLSNSAVIGKVLTGFTSSTGTILATDSILQAIQKLDGNLAAATAGGVSSVTGTTNRITSTGGSNPIIDISASYVGQSSITTLGTITTGVWNGTAIGDSYISSASTWNAKQTAYTNLTSIGTLANAAGVLTNDGSGVFSYATVTGYTTEEAQDAVGAMVDSTLVYVDATPLLTRAALTGAITASQGSNTTSLGSFTLSQLNTAISDADVATGGGTATGTNTGDNAVNTLYSGLVSNATHTGDATGATALTVVGINGTLLSGLTTGILKNTTGTGVPSIAVAGDFPTLNQNTTGSAATLTTGRTIAITGDLAYTSPSFNGSGNVTAVGTLATVNANVGSFGNATQVASFTVNAKGLITAASNITITPSASSITGGAALTKVDDTNVTLTLGGSPTTALLGATSLTLGWTGVLSTSRGGTGIGTLGTALQQLRVNAGGTALEYFTPSGGGITSLNALTGATQTFTNDTNVTIVSGGTAHVITWSGTLADSRITSASNWNLKQAGIQFQDEGSNLGTSNTVTGINFTGNGISASRTGNIITVDVGATSGVTNLTYTTSATNGIVVSDTGSDATIPAATTLIAGLMIPAQFDKLANITITQAVDLDALESDVADLTTLSGVASNATTLGTFTGTTIPDSSTVKAVLQSLETATEANFTTNNRQYKIRVVSVSTSISATTDGTVVFDTASTVATLPSPTNELMLVVMNASAGNITVTGHINGVAAQTFTISSLESYKFHSNGSTFYII